MVTGQQLRDSSYGSVGSSREAIRAEDGVCDYATIRKRNILTAREKALRCSDDHPARIAVSNNDTKQRLAIREGFRSNADKLAEFLPPVSVRKCEKTDRSFCTKTLGGPLCNHNHAGRQLHQEVSNIWRRSQKRKNIMHQKTSQGLHHLHRWIRHIYSDTILRNFMDTNSLKCLNIVQIQVFPWCTKTSFLRIIQKL